MPPCGLAEVGGDGRGGQQRNIEFDEGGVTVTDQPTQEIQKASFGDSHSCVLRFVRDDIWPRFWTFGNMGCALQ